jgi:quercetin dioxygenase-like cupin family protein
MTEKTYTASIATAPVAEDLTADEGWVNMRVQFLIDADQAGAERMVAGRTVLPPGGASHEWHRHPNAEEFVYVIRGNGVVLNDDEQVPVGPGQIVFHPANTWHGVRNTSDTEEMELLWAWAGASSKAAAGYEVRPLEG